MQGLSISKLQQTDLAMRDHGMRVCKSKALQKATGPDISSCGPPQAPKADPPPVHNFDMGPQPLMRKGPLPACTNASGRVFFLGRLSSKRQSLSPAECALLARGSRFPGTLQLVVFWSHLSRERTTSYCFCHFHLSRPRGIEAS